MKLSHFIPMKYRLLPLFAAGWSDRQAAAYLRIPEARARLCRSILKRDGLLPVPAAPPETIGPDLEIEGGASGE